MVSFNPINHSADNVIPPDTSHLPVCCGDTISYTSEDTTVTAAYAKLLYFLIDGDTLIPPDPVIILADEEEAFAEVSDLAEGCFGVHLYLNVDIACNVSPPYVNVMWCGIYDGEHVSMAIEHGFRNSCGLQTQVVIYTDTCNTADSVDCGGARIAQPGEDFDQRSTVEVYPNPTGGALTVKINSHDAAFYSIELTDITGRILYRDNLRIEKGINSRDLDFSKFTKGIYFFRFNSAILNKVIRIVKE